VSGISVRSCFCDKDPVDRTGPPIRVQQGVTMRPLPYCFGFPAGKGDVREDDEDIIWI
jgi:hypothetical protein